MKMNEPLGNPLYAPLLVRVPLAIYFALAGWEKLQNPAGFIEAVRKFHILPEPMATLYGILLPYVEIVAGVFLLFGIWTTLAAIITSLMLISFIIALGVREGMPFNKDIILLGLSLSLIFSGGGSWSVDRFRKTG